MSQAEEFQRSVAQSVAAARDCFKRFAVGTHLWKEPPHDRLAVFFEDGTATTITLAEWTKIRGW